jgi:DNA recombination protein RmuC
MSETLLIVLTVLNAGIIILLIVLFLRGSDKKVPQLESRLDSIQEKTEKAVREEIARNRDETAKSSREMRDEINNFKDSLINNMSKIANMQKNQLDTFSEQLNKLTASNEDRLEKMTRTVETKLEKMRETVEENLKRMQNDNTEQLEKMRQTVDEKLHKTLEERLGQSFKIVSEKLEQVHKGLGEMQNLAVGVGDLKKVLSNVKTRGILGEILLGNILEQILAPEQYTQNVATKKGSREHVEFAIKLPGRDDSDEVVYLPLDSKFPRESYQALLAAYDDGDPDLVEEAVKQIEVNIKKFAKDISDKYLDPPNTTDFGIMFLPIEGLYSEVVRRTDLIEVLQRKFKIIVTGPTTLAAILNSLQMGFRTLAIEKRSSEVWKVLGAVKTEFEKFGTVLQKAQDKIRQADKEIDVLVGTRTRVMQQKLKDVEKLPSKDSTLIISDDMSDNGDDA